MAGAARRTDVDGVRIDTTGWERIPPPSSGGFRFVTDGVLVILVGQMPWVLRRWSWDEPDLLAQEDRRDMELDGWTVIEARTADVGGAPAVRTLGRRYVDGERRMEVQGMLRLTFDDAMWIFSLRAVEDGITGMRGALWASLHSDHLDEQGHRRDGGSGWDAADMDAIVPQDPITRVRAVLDHLEATTLVTHRVASLEPYRGFDPPTGEPGRLDGRTEVDGVALDVRGWDAWGRRRWLSAFSRGDLLLQAGTHRPGGGLSHGRQLPQGPEAIPIVLDGLHGSYVSTVEDIGHGRQWHTHLELPLGDDQWFMCLTARAATPVASPPPLFDTEDDVSTDSEPADATPDLGGVVEAAFRDLVASAHVLDRV